MKFDFGKGDNNPFDSIRFFSKYDDNKGKKISLSTVSSFLPERFKETVVRFYYKPTDKPEEFMEAKRFLFNSIAIANIIIVLLFPDNLMLGSKKDQRLKL